MRSTPKQRRPSAVFEAASFNKVRLSGFDLSHEHKTTFNMGEVIPIGLIEAMPNDRFNLGANVILRMQPLVSPILHGVKLKIQAWFVANRLLMDQNADGISWEEFITGGDDGTLTGTLPLYDPSVHGQPGASIGSLWDRFGYNPIFDAGVTNLAPSLFPLIFPHRAYTKIWNDWFRIPGVQDEIPIFGNIDLLYARPFYDNWDRDYYTSALPFLQRGISPSLPVLGNLTASSSTTGNTDYNLFVRDGTTSAGAPDLLMNISGPGIGDFGTDINGAGVNDVQSHLNANLSDNTLNATTTTTVTANLSTVDIKQFRLAFLYQQFLELMARGGARYAEMLPAVYGARPLDQRLQRSEFIGGYTMPWLTTEVLQTSPQTDNGTSGDTTVQGTQAGTSINLSTGNLGRYQVDEHGWILITACTYPDAAYQQGMPRALLRRVREEFPSPSFAGLSEQEIFNAELYNQTTASDPTGSIGRTPFGYTGRYNEMRYLPSVVTSEMRTVFDYWHLGRKFSSLPVLNDTFVNMSSDDTVNGFRRIFAVQNVPGIIGTFGLNISAVRPIPFMAVPATLGGA